MKQFKLLMVAFALLMGATLSAQDKLGHINSQEILQLLPERAQAEQNLADFKAQLDNRMQALMSEYQGKVQAFQSLPEDTPTSTANDMRDEILGMEQRIQEYQVNAEQDLAQKQQDLIAPMLEKVQNAINEVGKENGFTYIYDSSTGVLVYINGEDITPLVKTKLGITG